LNSETGRRRERFEKRKRGLDADRLQARAQLGAWALHKQAVERLAKLSTVAAGSVEPSRGGSETVGPPRQQTLDQDPAWREHWDVIRSRLLRVHEKLDEAEGLGPTAAKTMLGVEKDREILTKGRGFTAQAVVDLLGRDIAGSAETVRRVRRKHGYSTRDGEPLPDPQTGTVRRVRID
jgi:hypothetical protein